jgi:RNA-binding protein PNO1
MEVENEWKTQKGKKRRASTAASTAMETEKTNEIVLEQPEVVESMEVGEEMISADQAGMPYEKPKFGKAKITGKMKKELRRIPVPPQRLTPLRNNWKTLLNPLVEHMQLQVRMNTKRRCVEIRLSKNTEDAGALQKGADFMKAFMLGF